MAPSMFTILGARRGGANLRTRRAKMLHRRSIHVRVGAASAGRAVFFQKSTGASRVSARSRARRLTATAVAVLALTAALGASAAQASLFTASSTFGSPGSAPGQFQSPLGVAIQQSSGNVYVADSQNARVQKFSPNGDFIAAFGQSQLS